MCVCVCVHVRACACVLVCVCVCVRKDFWFIPFCLNSVVQRGLHVQTIWMQLCKRSDLWNSCGLFMNLYTYLAVDTLFVACHIIAVFVFMCQRLQTFFQTCIQQMQRLQKKGGGGSIQPNMILHTQLRFFKEQSGSYLTELLRLQNSVQAQWIMAACDILQLGILHGNQHLSPVPD